MLKAKLTNVNIDKACREIEEFLSKKKLSSKELLKIKLDAEEALLFYQDKFGEESEFKLEKGSNFGRAKIRLSIPGDSYDPFATSEFSSDEDAMMRKALISMGKLPSWRFRRGVNEVIFTLEKKDMPEWQKLLIAIVSAVILGMLVRFSPESFRYILQEGIIQPLINTFLGFLNAVAGPMIFFSVVSAIYSIGDAATFSEIGKNLSIRYALFLCATTIICAVLAWPLFSLNFGSTHVGNDFSALYRMVLDIVPSNLFTPFSRGNTLQILFVAIIIGIAMLIIGKETQIAADLSEQLGTIVNGIMNFVSKMVPFFVFGSLFNIVVSSEFGMLAVGGKFFFATVLACIEILALHTLVTCIKIKMKPIDLWRKCFSTFIIGLTTASSSAAFSDNLKVCTEKLEISRRLANFGVPFGQILYKPAVCILFLMASLSVAYISGVELSVTWVFTALMIVIVLSAAAPPVPGGMSASFTILFAQLNLPMENLAVILSLTAVLDFVVTAVNLFSDQSVLVYADEDIN